MAKATQQASTQDNQISGKYTVDELAANAHLFDANPDIVKAALKVAKITECTVEEARDAVNKFAKKEAKQL